MRNVKIKFYKAINGKTAEGILRNMSGETVTVLLDDDNREIFHLKDISKINRTILI